MKINQKNKTKKRFISIGIALGIVVILFGSLALYLYKFNGNIFGWSPIHQGIQDGIDYNPPTQEEIDAGNVTKDDSISTDSTKNPKVDSENDEPSDNPTSDVKITIPSVTQDGNVMRVTTLIEKITSSGSCTLTLERDGKVTVTKTANVQASASSSTCMGFSISTTGLSGQWTLTVVYKDGSSTGSVSQSVSIQ